VFWVVFLSWTQTWCIVCAVLFVFLFFKFNKEGGKVVEEFKMRVIYIPANPPSPVPEEPEEDSSPRASMLENGHQNRSLFDAVSFSFLLS
jgi:hypothetical protein